MMTPERLAEIEARWNSIIERVNHEGDWMAPAGESWHDIPDLLAAVRERDVKLAVCVEALEAADIVLSELYPPTECPAIRRVRAALVRAREKK